MSVCCGEFHCICLSEDGKVNSVGNNDKGQLGLGHWNTVILPNEIQGLPQITKISCGRDYTMCIDTEGKLWAFGQNNKGQLGIGNNQMQNTPQQLLQIPPMNNISCGFHHTICTTNSGELWSFGSNQKGELCLGIKGENQLLPQRTPFSNIIKISADIEFSIFQNNKGEIFGCGRNDIGQLGIEKKEFQIQPTLIPNLPPEIMDFCSGVHHTLFLDKKGDVYSVGFNNSGQLGLNHNNNVFNATKIENIPKIKEISCGRWRSLLLDRLGNVWTFGQNRFGQLGCNDTDSRNVPTKINNLHNIQQISKGGSSYISLLKQNNDKVYVIGNTKYIQAKGGVYSTCIIPTELDDKYNTIWGNSIANSKENKPNWENCVEILGLKEHEVEKINKIEKRINKILQDNQNVNKLKQEFPRNSFDSWREVDSFLSKILNQINKLFSENKEKKVQYDEKVKSIDDEVHRIDIEINNLKQKKKELQENILPDAIEIQENLKKAFDIVSTKNDDLQVLSDIVKRFCENENQMNKDIFDLFTNKSFDCFDENDVSMLLWKMDLVQYQDLFIEHHINGDFVLLIDDSWTWTQLGIHDRDIFYLSYYFELMKSPNFIKTLMDDYEEDCFTCYHNTPEKTLCLIQEYNIPIDDKLILENNLCAPILTNTKALSLINVDIFSEKGRNIAKIFNKWKKTHLEHLHELRNKN